MNEYLTLSQFAQLIGTKKRGAMAHIQRGHIRAHRFGNAYAIAASDAAAFITLRATGQYKKPPGRPKKNAA